MFKKIADGCGGFIVVDENTTFFTELQWVRILKSSLVGFKES